MRCTLIGRVVNVCFHDLISCVDWKDEEGNFHNKFEVHFGIEQMIEDYVMT
jgi:hypothetical protein